MLPRLRAAFHARAYAATIIIAMSKLVKKSDTPIVACYVPMSKTMPGQ
jgi:hypothetical protein